jgi:hypothetical protein
MIGLSALTGFIVTRYVHPWIELLQEPARTFIIWTEMFSVPFFIAIVFWFLNEYGWKWRCLKWLINIPNLNGRYVGTLISSYEENGKPVTKDCALEIKQSASSIHISAYFGDLQSKNVSSKSSSVSEQIVEMRSGMFMLYYIFHNETDSLQIQLTNHIGTVKFDYYGDIQTLRGAYYNQLKNTGTIEVRFSQTELLGRLV